MVERQAFYYSRIASEACGKHCNNTVTYPQSPSQPGQSPPMRMSTSHVPTSTYPTFAAKQTSISYILPLFSVVFIPTTGNEILSLLTRGADE